MTAVSGHVDAPTDRTTHRRVALSAIIIVVIIAAALLLPAVRAATSQAPDEAPAGRLAFTDQDAISEANLVWDNPIERLAIRAAAVTSRAPCPEPYASNPLQGTIEESRVVEAYTLFGLTLSTVTVDCHGDSWRS